MGEGWRKEKGAGKGVAFKTLENELKNETPVKKVAATSPAPLPLPIQHLFTSPLRTKCGKGGGGRGGRGGRNSKRRGGRGECGEEGEGERGKRI